MSYAETLKKGNLKTSVAEICTGMIFEMYTRGRGEVFLKKIRNILENLYILIYECDWRIFRKFRRRFLRNFKLI